jgi:hypothetical protein
MFVCLFFFLIVFEKKGPSLNAVFHEMVARICALVDGGETWQHKIISALEHASKTYR